MADNKIEISFGVILSALQSGMSSATASVESATGAMGAAIAAMSAKSTSAIAGMASSMKSEFNGITSSLGSLQNKILAFTAVLAGGLIFRNIIKETVDWNFEALKLSKTLGITTQAASILTVALGDSFNTLETYLHGSTMLTRTLGNNEKAFKDLGVETRDSAQHLRSTGDIMQDVILKLSSMKAGTDRNVEGQRIYHKSWVDVINLMRLTPEVFEKAKKKAEELGLVVGPEGVKQAKDYKLAMRDTEDVLKSLKMQIGNALLPVLTDLGAWFSKTGPKAIEMFAGAIKGIVTFIQYLTLGFIVLYETAKTVIDGIIDDLQRNSSVLDKILKGDIKGAIEDAASSFKYLSKDNILASIFGDPKKATAGLQQFGTQSESLLSRINSAVQKTNESVMRMWGLLPKVKMPEMPDEGTGHARPGEDKKGKMSEWEAELDALRAKESLAQGHFIEFSVQQEIDFWQKKLTETKKGTEDRIAVSKRVATLEYENYKQMFAAEIIELKASNVQFKQGAEGRIAIAKAVAEKIKAAGFGMDSKEMQAANKEIMAAEKERADFLFNLEIEKLKATESAYKESYEMRLGIARQIVDQIAAQGEAETTKYEEAKKHIEEIEREHQDTLYKIGLDRIKNDEAAERAGSIERVRLAKDYAEKVKAEKGAESTDYIQALGHIEAVTREHNDKMFEIEIARMRLEENATKQTAESRLSIANEIAAKMKAKWGESSTEYINEQENVTRRDKELHSEALNVKLEKMKEEELAYKKGSDSIIESAKKKADAIKEDKGVNSPEHLAALLEVARAEKEQKDYLFNLELEHERIEEAAYSNSTARRVQLARDRAVKVGVREGTESMAFLKEMANVQTREKEHDDEVKSIEAAKLEREKANADFMIEMERERLNTLVALNRITADEKDRILQAYADKQYTRELEDMNRRLALLKNEPVKYEMLYNQIEAMKEKHTLAMQKLGDQEKVSMFNQIKGIVEPTTAAFSSMIKGMLHGTMTLRNGLKSIMDSIANTFINKCTEMLTNWIATELGKLAITKTIKQALISLGIMEADKEVATQATATAETKAIQASTGPAMVMSNAAVGASAAGASVASIPYVGWSMVAGVTESIYTLLSAFAPLAAMAGGADVPHDMVAQVHAREMVLPAHLADKIRNMSDSGKVGPSQTHVFKGLNPKSLYTGSDFIKTMKRLQRDGHFS